MRIIDTYEISDFYIIAISQELSQLEGFSFRHRVQKHRFPIQVS